MIPENHNQENFRWTYTRTRRDKRSPERVQREGGGHPHPVRRRAASQVQTIPASLSLGANKQGRVRAQAGQQLLPHGAAPGALQGCPQ